MCDIGKRIRNRRVELEYSAEDLAAMVGLSPATIYRYENGGIKKVSTNKVNPIAVALKTSAAYLMGWTDDPSESMSSENKVSDIDSYSDAHQPFSAKAAKVAHAYDSMSPYGKSLIDAIIENENKYMVGKRLPSIEEVTGYKVGHPSDSQARYNAAQDLKELSMEELDQHPSRIMR